MADVVPTTTRRKFKTRKQRSAEAARELEAPTNLSRISANVFGAAGPERRLLRDTKFTKRIVVGDACVVDVVSASDGLGEG